MSCLPGKAPGAWSCIPASVLGSVAPLRVSGAVLLGLPHTELFSLPCWPWA